MNVGMLSGISWCISWVGSVSFDQFNTGFCVGNGHPNARIELLDEGDLPSGQLLAQVAQMMAFDDNNAVG